MGVKRAVVAALTLILFVAPACGVRPSSVVNGGNAPTDIAEGTPICYVTGEGELVPDHRGEPLETIGQALKILLTTPYPSAGLHSRVGSSKVTLELPITKSSGLITGRLPLDRDDVSGKNGVDQLVCTDLAVRQQAGGSAGTKARFTFAHGADACPRHCPVLPTE